MNIREMEIYRQVCAEGGITRASRSMYLSPQSVSKTLKNMESELGCELLLRTKKGVVPTKSGERLLEYADGALRDFYSLKNDLSLIRQEQKGEVDMLSAYGILRLISPDCIEDFRNGNPNIDFNYREYPDREVERMFLAGEGNVAFSVAPFPVGLYDVTVLHSSPLLMLVYDGHRLCGRKSVSVRELRGERLYIESSEFKVNQMIVSKCRENGFSPDIAFETSGFSLCHKMVRERRGVSVTVDFIFGDMKGEGLTAIPFEEDDLKWTACMLTRRGEKPPEAVNAFCDHVRRNRFSA